MTTGTPARSGPEPASCGRAPCGPTATMVPSAEQPRRSSVCSMRSLRNSDVRIFPACFNRPEEEMVAARMQRDGGAQRGDGGALRFRDGGDFARRFDGAARKRGRSGQLPLSRRRVRGRARCRQERTGPPARCETSVGAPAPAPGRPACGAPARPARTVAAGVWRIAEGQVLRARAASSAETSKCRREPSTNRPNGSLATRPVA